ADPDDLARGAELVQLCRLIAGYAARQDLGLPERDRKGKALQRNERLSKRGAPVDAVPAGEESREGRLLDRLDLLAQSGERRAPKPAQHVRVAPLALASARTKLPPEPDVLTVEVARDRLGVVPEALVRLRGRERPSAARETEHELTQRLRAALEEDLRQPTGGHGAESVAVATGVLGCDEPLLARNTHDDRPPL